jgi:hypothetical protein
MEDEGRVEQSSAVVQLNETTGEFIAQVEGQDCVLDEDGRGTVLFHNTEFPIYAAILNEGTIPDEERIDEEQPFKAGKEVWDSVANAMVTHPEPNLKPFPGRTIVGADVVLTVGGVPCHQEPLYKGMGSHVTCGTDVWRRYTNFIVPYTIFGVKVAHVNIHEHNSVE